MRQFVKKSKYRLSLIYLLCFLISQICQMIAKKVKIYIRKVKFLNLHKPKIAFYVILNLKCNAETIYLYLFFLVLTQ